jgi:hypothetical protein
MSYNKPSPNKHASPFKFWGALANTAVGVIGMVGAGKRKRAAEEKEAAARAEMQQFKSDYMEQDISNPYARLTNQYAGMKNQFAGLENTMEDLTVNQQQAQFEAQQFQQSQANIMDTMAQSAGGSGIAATVQALAQQGQLQAQQSSASIGAQEAQNQMAAAQQAGQLQQMEAQGAQQVDMMARQGQAQLDSQVAAGEQVAQQRELDRTATLLGMSQQETAAYQQQAAQAGAQKMDALGKTVSGIGSLAANFLSDRRLKKNIKLIGKSPNGINIYIFEYINNIFGKGIFQGVMSDDIPVDAVVKHKSGYDMVDYSKIDVEFKNI